MPTTSGINCSLLFTAVIRVMLFSHLSLSVTLIFVFSVPGSVILALLKALNGYFWASVSVKNSFTHSLTLIRWGHGLQKFALIGMPITLSPPQME